MSKLTALPLFLFLIAMQNNKGVCGINGIDVSTPVSVADFQCLKKTGGKEFVIVRVWRNRAPAGQVDQNAVSTMENAWAAGMSQVDGYIFPRFTSQPNDSRQQIRTLLNYLDSEKSARYGKLWLDIEGTQYWGKNQMENVKFIQELVDELKAQGKSIGFYTSASQWRPITGNSQQFSAYPLWFAHYNGQRNFDDFVPFGGWQMPTMKQFSGDVQICGKSVDENWKPS